MNRRKQIWAMLFLLHALAVHTQHDLHLSTPQASDSETKALFDRYLRDTDSAETKINRLLALVPESSVNELPRQFRHLQTALVLEKSVPYPCSATFKLNKRIGNLFYDINPSFAIFYFEKAIAIGLKIPDHPHMNGIYNSLAGLYLRVNQPASSLDCYRRGLAVVPTSDSVMRSSVLNNIGWLFSKIDQSDSALKYFGLASAHYAGKHADDDLYSNILENIAKEEERRGEYGAALEKYIYNVGVYTRLGNHSNYVRNRFNEIRARAALAMPVADILHSLHLFIEERKNEITVNDALQFYRWATEHAKNYKVSAPASYGAAYIYWRELIAGRQLEKASALTNVLLAAQSFNFKSAHDAYTAELRAAQAASHTNKVIATLAFILCAVIFLAAAFYYKRRKRELQMKQMIIAAELKANQLETQHAQSELEKERMQRKNELAMTEIEQRAMQNQLDLKKKHLTQVILLNKQVYENNKEIIRRLDEIAGHPDRDTALKSLLFDLRSRNQLQDRAASSQNNTDHLLAEFYHKLKRKFPKLTRAEVELCGYILNDLSNKDIALLRNVEPASVKLSRNRLRKKLNLAPDEDLPAFIRSI